MSCTTSRDEALRLLLFTPAPKGLGTECQHKHTATAGPTKPSTQMAARKSCLLTAPLSSQSVLGCSSWPDAGDAQLKAICCSSFQSHVLSYKWLCSEVGTLKEHLSTPISGLSSALLFLILPIV